jgi:hypothetical protein
VTPATGTAPAIALEPTPRKPMWLLAVGAFAVIILAVLGWWLFRGRRTHPRATVSHKSVAVRYFANLSQDKSLDWLDRGLTEMLTTNLAQVQGLDVLSSERIQGSLQRLGKNDGGAMEPGLAQAVARAASADAFVTGALLKVGPGGPVGLLEEELTKSDIPCPSLGRLPLPRRHRTRWSGTHPRESVCCVNCQSWTLEAAVSLSLVPPRAKPSTTLPRNSDFRSSHATFDRSVVAAVSSWRGFARAKRHGFLGQM